MMGWVKFFWIEFLSAVLMKLLSEMHFAALLVKIRFLILNRHPRRPRLIFSTF